MERVLEPELMTDDDQARAYAGADFARAHQSYVTQFAEVFPDAPASARVLDLGCGPGDVTFRFAAAYPGWVFDAVDGSPAMLLPARDVLIRRPDLAARVHLIEGLLPDVPLPEGGYDIILSSSVLHHLHDPQALWQTITRHAGPDTRIFVCDLFRPDSPEAAAALVAAYAGGEPDVLRRDFYNSLRAAFTPAEVTGQLMAAGLAALRVTALSDRHMVISGRLQVE